MPKGYEVARTAVKHDNRLRAAVPRNARLVALDERGRDYSTRQFAELLNTETAFLIGGPDGLSPEIRQEAAVLLRLSSLTLPHALAQVVLLEQIYRAASILTGHPYHRE
jgi:23S rRNA (pseudouridine1915-N3)-methyltransferase